MEAGGAEVTADGGWLKWVEDKERDGTRGSSRASCKHGASALETDDKDWQASSSVWQYLEYTADAAVWILKQTAEAVMEGVRAETERRRFEKARLAPNLKSAVRDGISVSPADVLS